jgi:hypothetical protein
MPLASLLVTGMSTACHKAWLSARLALPNLLCLFLLLAPGRCKLGLAQRCCSMQDSARHVNLISDSSMPCSVPDRGCCWACHRSCPGWSRQHSSEHDPPMWQDQLVQVSKHTKALACTFAGQVSDTYKPAAGAPHGLVLGHTRSCPLCTVTWGCPARCASAAPSGCCAPAHWKCGQQGCPWPGAAACCLPAPQQHLPPWQLLPCHQHPPCS